MNNWVQCVKFLGFVGTVCIGYWYVGLVEITIYRRGEERMVRVDDSGSRELRHVIDVSLCMAKGI